MINDRRQSGGQFFFINPHKDHSEWSVLTLIIIVISIPQSHRFVSK